MQEWKITHQKYYAGKHEECAVLLWCFAFPETLCQSVNIHYSLMCLEAVFYQTCWFCSAPQPLPSLAFAHYCPFPDELECRPFKCWGQYPCEGWGWSAPRSGQGEEGGDTPGLLWRQRVTLKTQSSDVSWRRKMFRGLDLFVWEQERGLNSFWQLGLSVLLLLFKFP